MQIISWSSIGCPMTLRITNWRSILTQKSRSIFTGNSKSVETSLLLYDLRHQQFSSRFFARTLTLITLTIYLRHVNDWWYLVICLFTYIYTYRLCHRVCLRPITDQIFCLGYWQILMLLHIVSKDTKSKSLF